MSTQLGHMARCRQSEKPQRTNTSAGYLGRCSANLRFERHANRADLHLRFGGVVPGAYDCPVDITEEQLGRIMGCRVRGKGNSRGHRK